MFIRKPHIAISFEAQLLGYDPKELSFAFADKTGRPKMIRVV